MDGSVRNSADLGPGSEGHEAADASYLCAGRRGCDPCGRRMWRAAPNPAGVETAPPVRSTAAHDATFPLAISPNRRYLVDHRKHPFLIVGDSPQSLFVNISVEQAKHFLVDRKAAGFNAVWVNLLCESYTGGRPDGSTYDGIRPFRQEGDLSTPNEAYFARADAMIRLAAKQRMAVFLDPIETGGWLSVLRDNGLAKAYSFGRYLGLRYRKFPNIVWMSGNDFQSWRTPSDDALVLAVARGIKATDPNQLQTTELNFLDSGSLDDTNWKGLISLDSAYTYLPTYARVLKEYRREDHLPVFMVEANYEGENAYTGTKDAATPGVLDTVERGHRTVLRKQVHMAVPDGVAGAPRHGGLAANDVRDQPLRAASLVRPCA